MKVIRVESQQAADPTGQLQSASNHEGQHDTGPSSKPASKLVRPSESITVEDLMKAFEKLSVNLVQQMQQQQ